MPELPKLEAGDSIWFATPRLDEANVRGNGTMVSHLAIQVSEIGPGFMKATMPVDDTTRQPVGILHGGATLALMETVGSDKILGVVINYLDMPLSRRYGYGKSGKYGRYGNFGRDKI